MNVSLDRYIPLEELVPDQHHVTWNLANAHNLALNVTATDEVRRATDLNDLSIEAASAQSVRALAFESDAQPGMAQILLPEAQLSHIGEQYTRTPAERQTERALDDQLRTALRMLGRVGLQRVVKPLHGGRMLGGLMGTGAALSQLETVVPANQARIALGASLLVFVPLLVGGGLKVEWRQLPPVWRMRRTVSAALPATRPLLVGQEGSGSFSVPFARPVSSHRRLTGSRAQMPEPIIY